MQIDAIGIVHAGLAALSARPADSDMVERVAKALFEHDRQWMFGSFPEITRAWGELPASCQDDWRNKARAAIAAMGSADMGKGEG